MADFRRIARGKIENFEFSEFVGGAILNFIIWRKFVGKKNKYIGGHS